MMKNIRTELVLININTNLIIEKIPAPNAVFLNDIAIDENQNVYISDMANGSIYIFSQGSIDFWIENELSSPNGLYYKNGNLLIGTKDNITQVNISSKEKTELYTKTGSIDGLKRIGENKYIISDWQGNINILSPENNKQLILSTVNQEINAADFEYVETEKLLFIPTFFDNRVTIYQLEIIN